MYMNSKNFISYITVIFWKSEQTTSWAHPSDYRMSGSILS